MTDQTEIRQELLANQLERLSNLEHIYRERMPLPIKQEVEELKIEISRVTTALGERNVTPTMMVVSNEIGSEEAPAGSVGFMAQIGRMIGRDAISVGKESGASIAIGRSASVAIKPQLEITSRELAYLFAPLAEAARDNVTIMVQINALREEIMRGENASDAKVAGLIEDIAEAIPGSVEFIDSIIMHPAVAKTSGAATKSALRYIRRRERV